MIQVHVDFETRSELSIFEVDAWTYSTHPSTKVLCMVYAIAGDKPVLLKREYFDGGGAEPEELFSLNFEDSITIAHNSFFEYCIWENILHKKLGWSPHRDLNGWECTLSRASACSLPKALGKVGPALGATICKDEKGSAAMKKLSKPIAILDIDDHIKIDKAEAKGHEIVLSDRGATVWHNTPELYETLYSYCITDVESERAIDDMLPPLSPTERKVWMLDQAINLRGVAVDMEMVDASLWTIDEYTKIALKNLRRDSKGEVESVTRIAALTRWLGKQGVEVTDLQKSTVSALLDDPGTPLNVKQVLGVRRQLGKSSTKKYNTIKKCGGDGRLRGTLIYHAAGTGRWAGKYIQPQNLPRGNVADTDACVADIKKRDLLHIELAYDGVMEALSSCIRGTLVAGEGKDLIVADYASIESRVLLWEAGDDLALAKYRQGINLYIDMAKTIYNKDGIVKGTPEYAVGKETILGSGYGMGWRKFQATCATKGITLSDEEAENIIRIYRRKYKSVTELWKATERAAVSAVRSPGKVYASGHCRWKVVGRFLVCQLPSGRHMRFFSPKLKRIDTPYGEKDEIHFLAIHAKTNQFVEHKTYGGKLVENIIQAIARDIMAAAMLRCDDAGYDIVLTVHDEIVTEVLEGEKSLDELIELMCVKPAWLGDCPIGAEGWRGKRYKK